MVKVSRKVVNPAKNRTDPVSMIKKAMVKAVIRIFINDQISTDQGTPKTKHLQKTSRREE